VLLGDQLQKWGEFLEDEIMKNNSIEKIRKLDEAHGYKHGGDMHF